MPSEAPERDADWHRHWPVAQVFALDGPRLLYLPIAKCACTSLKRAMVALSGHPRAAEILAGDVHHLTDTGATGLILHDRTAEEAARIVAAPGWFRFAVVRDPFDRLVSAYVDKFVRNRAKPFYRQVLGPVWLAATGAGTAAEVDFDRGISFRAFVDGVARLPRGSLDPHIRPQVDYFDAVALDRLYAFEDLGRLAADLEARAGVPVALPHANRTRAGAVLEGGCLADATAADLDAEAGSAAPARFYDATLRARVARLFAADITLHRMALGRRPGLGLRLRRRARQR